MLKRSRLFWIALLGLCSVAEIHALEPWKILSDCHLMVNPANDGDSFHIKENDKEYIVRLYFVDATETNDEFSDRVSEQASYFHIKHADAIRVGKVAAKFTAVQLKGAFTVVTRFQDAMGRSHLPRYYGFVIANNKDLGELLVEQGLARIHGEHVIKPDGTSTKGEITKLETLEARAKRDRRGAWAAQPGDNVAFDPATAGLRISPTGDRHNSRCTLFSAPFNKPCTANDGKPCRICGG